tara:strand:- start:178 stop:384 length:207 start_codon:yes stop_codon:yes gene_type:complete
MMTEEKTIKIDDKDYKLSDLSKTSVDLINQMTLVHNKKTSLLQEIDILNQANETYSAKLKLELEKGEG